MREENEQQRKRILFLSREVQNQVDKDTKRNEDWNEKIKKEREINAKEKMDINNETCNINKRKHMNGGRE